jgi:hypothetical protein
MHSFLTLLGFFQSLDKLNLFPLHLSNKVFLLPHSLLLGDVAILYPTQGFNFLFSLRLHPSLRERNFSIPYLVTLSHLEHELTFALDLRLHSKILFLIHDASVQFSLLVQHALPNPHKYLFMLIVPLGILLSHLLEFFILGL